ncbi:MAG TPA: OmpA family protein [Candidatus Acidoferrales bacterium]|nr:OmpA family protein [Candidatus Acidoferrales bacterium]
MRRFGYLFVLALTLVLCATTSFAQDGKLKVKVTPKQAYLFVDGQAIREGNQSISLSAGKHTVVVVNYGYKIHSEEVNIEPGKTTDVTVALEAYGGTVNGPFGDVMFKNGDRRAAVLSNGTTPNYFVGHVDEFDWDWLWHQNLLLPAGTHHITITRKGNTVWSGDVTVVAGKKVIVDISKNGSQKTVNWTRGNKMPAQPRFKAGFASTTVAVAPVTVGAFSASATNINCGQSSTLSWSSNEAVASNISGIGDVPPSGSQSVSPHATTTYDFTASGPGGSGKGTATVDVNTKVDASLSANPTDVHYRKIGDKVITQDSSTLTWTTGNADNVTLDGNKVDASGNETVKAEPADTSSVPEGGQPRTIDESKSFTLSATNVCGGSSTQTAALHITGSVEPIPQVLLQSVFYPTDYPDKRHPEVGLVKSQQLELATLAAGFKKYLEYDPDAKLSVEAYADVRGGKEFNQELSERRVERIKQYLVDQGVAADKVETAAYGKERPLDKKVVKDLEEANPNKAPKARERNATGNWYAYNRRADIVLLPSGKKSSQYFPHNADDSGIIWQIPKPSLKKVEAAQ